jgi:hypothetical protein
MRRPVPDAVIYRIFLHHVAAFERRARSNEAKGGSGDAFRNHLIRKFGITSNEQKQIAEMALSFDTASKPLVAQRKAIVTDFRSKNFPDGKHRQGQPLPSLPVELTTIRGSINALTLQTRDQLRSALGDDRFALLDSAVRAKFQHDFNTTVAK